MVRFPLVERGGGGEEYRRRVFEGLVSKVDSTLSLHVKTNSCKVCAYLRSTTVILTFVYINKLMFLEYSVLVELNVAIVTYFKSTFVYSKGVYL